MKKLLLLSLIASGASMSFAQNSSQYFTLTYEGKQLADGETIICNNMIDESTYDADIKVLNVQGFEFPIYGILEYANNDEASNPTFYGQPYLCYETLMEMRRDGAWISVMDGICYGDRGPATLYPDMLPQTNVASDFTWLVKIINVNPEATTHMVFTMWAADGDVDDYTIIEDSKISINITYTKDGAGVDQIGYDNNEVPVYYNLQGVRVSNPENGIFIEKRGKNVSKVYIKK